MYLEVFGEYQDKIDCFVDNGISLKHILSWLACQSKIDERLLNDSLYFTVYDYIHEVAL